MLETQIFLNESNLLYNYNYYQKLTNKNVIAIVKSNAYGHGLKEISKVLDQNNVYMLGVTNINEAIYLRKNHIKSEILILEPILEKDLNNCLFYNLTISITSLKQFFKLKNKSLYSKLKIHLKIDTGMHRLGLNFDEFKIILNELKNNNKFILKGIYTHLVSTEIVNNYIINQTKNFQRYINEVKDLNIDIHMCTTSTLKYDLKDCNTIRIGLGLYGLDSITKPVLEMNSYIINRIKINKNEYAGYHNSFKAKENGYIYTIPFGYSSGILINNKIKLKIGNKKIKLVGQKCMNMSLLFSKNKYEEGQIVTIFDEKYSILDFSKQNKRSPYEVTSNLNPFIKRIVT